MKRSYKFIFLASLIGLFSTCTSPEPNYLLVFNQLSKNLEELQASSEFRTNLHFQSLGQTVNNAPLNPTVQVAKMLHQETSQVLFYVDSLKYLAKNRSHYPDLMKTLELGNSSDTVGILKQLERQLNHYRQFMHRNFNQEDCWPLYYILDKSDYKILFSDSLAQIASNPLAHRPSFLATLYCFKIDLLLYEQSILKRLLPSENMEAICPLKPSLKIFPPHDTLRLGQTYEGIAFLGLNANQCQVPDLQPNLYLKRSQVYEKIQGNQVQFTPSDSGEQSWNLEFTYYNIKQGKDSTIIIEQPYFVQ